MNWRNVLKDKSNITGNIGNLGKIVPFRSEGESNISDFSDISAFSKSKKPSLEQIFELIKELEAFEERAAIIEFDGDETREIAEQLAYAELIQKLESYACFSWFSFNKCYKFNYH